MPLWFNSSLNFEYRKKWKELGYQLVGDILNREGELLSLEDMRKRNLKINFLDYFEIKIFFLKYRMQWKTGRLFMVHIFREFYLK